MRKIEEELDIPVRIIERQSHIAGNTYDGNIFLCGRMAEFRYIDMHTCIEHALDNYKNIRHKLMGNNASGGGGYYQHKD